VPLFVEFTNMSSAADPQQMSIDASGSGSGSVSNYNIPDTTSPRSAENRIARSWSLGMMEEYIKQQPALPSLIAAASRTRNKQKGNAMRAAIRSALTTARREGTTSLHRQKAGRPGEARQTTPTLQPKASYAKPLQRQTTQPFGSGPRGIVLDEPTRGPSPGASGSRTEGDHNPSYLIRTDLRYSPQDDTVYALLELPGLRLEDVQLKLGSRSSGIRHLIITATSHKPHRNMGEVAMQERLYGTFTRTLIVPPHVSANDIQAEMRDGLLKLKILGIKFEEVVIK